MAFKLIFFGDFCAASGQVPTFGPKLQDLIASSSIASINLEGPVLSNSFRGIEALKIGPSISQPAIIIDELRLRGINMLNLANNHIMDYGLAGLKQTLKLSKSFHTIGASINFDEAYNSKIIKIEGVTMAFLGFSESQFGIAHKFSGGYACINSVTARLKVAEARKNADFVFIQVHAGIENVDIPLPEWRTIYKELIDLGADLIIGHHPHVVQGYEVYKGKHIYYSLGNLYMDLANSEESDYGAALIVKIDESLNNNIIGLRNDGQSIELDHSEEFINLFLSRTAKIQSSSYLAEINQICQLLWKNNYLPYYQLAFSSFLDHLRNFRIKKAFKILFNIINNDNLMRDLMVVHNARIESHRWAIDRAISSINKNKI